MGLAETTSAIPGKLIENYSKTLTISLWEITNIYQHTQRFNNALKAYEGTGVEKPKVTLQVAMFIRHLHDGRFGEFKTSIKSDFHQAAIAYPDSINAAFLRSLTGNLIILLQLPIERRLKLQLHLLLLTSPSYHTTASTPSSADGKETKPQERSSDRGRG
jgi:hypothetical protein